MRASIRIGLVVALSGVAAFGGPIGVEPPSSFTPLGDLPDGVFRSVAEAVSADGSVVAGTGASATGLEAFRWTATDGIEGLGDLPGGSAMSSAYAVSGDGTAVFGASSSTLSGESRNEGFRWTRGGGMTGLGVLPGGLGASAVHDASYDGSVLAGTSSTTGALFQACAWFSGSITELPDLVGGTRFSNAYGVSAAGLHIVGQGTSSDGARAARLATSGATALAGITGMISSSAMGVSADGTVIVGQISDATGTRAARWVGAGVERFGDVPGWSQSLAEACSADGSVVVGSGYDDSGPQAFVWTEADGMRALRDVLRDAGVVGLSGWKFTRASDVSDDGRTVVGEGTNPGGSTEAWVAVLGGPAAQQGAFLPTTVQVTLNKKKPARSKLTVKGAIDVGSAPPDLALPFTLRVGSTTIAVPSLTRRSNGTWTHRRSGLSVTLVPRTGSSRVGLSLSYTGPLPGVSSSGDLDAILTGDRIAGAATVTLVRGRFTLGRPAGSLLVPSISVAAATAGISSTKPHTLTLVAAVAVGPATAFPQDVRIVFGALDRTIPRAEFRLAKGRWTYAAPGPGITKIVLDRKSESMTVTAKGVPLGTFGAGPQAVPVRVSIGAWTFDGVLGLRRSKSTLTY